MTSTRRGACRKAPLVSASRVAHLHIIIIRIRIRSRHGHARFDGPYRLQLGLHERHLSLDQFLKSPKPLGKFTTAHTLKL
jgi:hypothetical protein